MKRIAILTNSNLKPEKADFEALQTQLILNRNLCMFVLKENGTIEMVHGFQLDSIARKAGFNSNLRELLCSFVDKLPDNCWDRIREELHFNKTL